MMQKYYVVVEDPVHKDSIHAELTSPAGSSTMPNRSVDCHDKMPFSEYNAVFLLDDAEAIKLKSDPRVRDVHLDFDAMGVKRGHCGIRAGDYNKDSTSMTPQMKNWALARCVSSVENFGSNLTMPNYTYDLTGKGVDIIILDTGVEKNHPEFAINSDGTGGSRVVDIDWTIYRAITSPPIGGFAGDSDGHGTNVASIAAGNTCGWASDAAIYSLRIFSGIDITTGATLGAIDELSAWQTIRQFHLLKPVNPATGYKKPTIVNCSYGFYRTYTNVRSITYRGITHISNTTNAAAYGTINTTDIASGGSHGVLISSVDAEISSALAAGVIVIGAAANYSHKIDVPGGLDYNNYWTGGSPYGSSYYHRGSTPGATPGVICVGAISQALPEHKVSFSCTGPRIDVFAPGNLIAGAYSSATYILSSAPDIRNSSYWLNKISGTSQATPQVVGVAALILEARPYYKPAELLSFIVNNSAKNQLNETYYGGTGYTSWASLQGAANTYLYIPFNNPVPLQIS